MRDDRSLILKAAGPPGALGCGLALVFLGLFLLTPLAVLLIKGIGWALTAVGVVLCVLALWGWSQSRRF